MVKARISTTDAVAPGQIGWVFFQEGSIEVAVKVIRGKRGVFLAFPTIKRQTFTVNVVSYVNRDAWEERRRQLLRIFRDQVGEEYYRNSVPSLSFRE